MTTDLPAFSASSSHVRDGLDAADHLDDDVHVRPRDQRGRVRREQLAQLGMPVGAPHGHPDQLDGRAHAGREIGRLLTQQPHHLAPDRAAAQHRDADRCSYPPRRLRKLRLLPSPGTYPPRRLRKLRLLPSPGTYPPRRLRLLPSPGLGHWPTSSRK